MPNAIRLVVRDYWTREFSHRPYRTVLHDDKDKPLTKHDILTELLESAGARDGDEVQISVAVTGARPFGDIRWCLQRPHEYGPETVEQQEKADGS